MAASSSGEVCDRCHVAAAAVLYLRGELELTLCAHHDREHGALIVAQRFDRYELDVPYLRVGGASAIPG